MLTKTETGTEIRNQKPKEEIMIEVVFIVTEHAAIINGVICTIYQPIGRIKN